MFLTNDENGLKKLFTKPKNIDNNVGMNDKDPARAGVSGLVKQFSINVDR